MKSSSVCNGAKQKATHKTWRMEVGSGHRAPHRTRATNLFGFCLDISARKAELQRRTSEERFAALVGASATIVWRSLPSGELVESSNWNDYTGQTPKKARIGLSRRDLRGRSGTGRARMERRHFSQCPPRRDALPRAASFGDKCAMSRRAPCRYWTEAATPSNGWAPRRRSR
jgi:hypothetical protein